MAIARFTPSLLDGDSLERLFVHRHEILDRIVADVRRATEGDERHHVVLVGPRGAGKTHLVSLVNHRCEALRAAGTRVQMSWLPEDPWLIDTYDDLLEAIGEGLGRRGPTTERELVNAAESAGPIVVLIENLDQVLSAIGGEGQRRLRAFLENTRTLLLVSTSTRLSAALTEQDEPFFGFFSRITLEPFAVAQAADMLVRIAEFEDDPVLAGRIRDPAALARLSTIEHLAGGQPRIWALFGTGLSITSTDELVDALVTRFDDLTPYYQEQLGRLSKSEAKIVRHLADADRPLTVGELATAAGVEPGSASKTVSDLRRRGWLRPHTSLLTERLDSRLTFYDLAEPLVRLAFQVKAARGRPIRLVVDFLASWFDLEHLRRSDEAQVSDVAQAYLTAAAAQHGAATLLASGLAQDRAIAYETANPELVSILESVDDALAALEGGDALPMMHQPAAISRLIEHLLEGASPTRVRIDLARLALDAGGDWRTRLDTLDAGPDDILRVSILLHRLVAEVSVDPESPFIQVALSQLGRLSARLPVAGFDLDVKYAAERIRVRASAQLAYDLAVRFDRPHQSDIDNAGIRTSVIIGLQSLGRTAEAVNLAAATLYAVTQSFGVDSVDADFWRIMLGTAYRADGRAKDAIDLFERELAGMLSNQRYPSVDTARAQGVLALSYLDDERHDDAIRELERAIETLNSTVGSDYHFGLMLRGLLATEYWEGGRAAEGVAVLERLVIDSTRALGPDHPNSLHAQSVLESVRE